MPPSPPPPPPPPPRQSRLPPPTTSSSAAAKRDIYQEPTYGYTQGVVAATKAETEILREDEAEKRSTTKTSRNRIVTADFGPNGLGPNGLGPNGLGQNGLGQNGSRPAANYLTSQNFIPASHIQQHALDMIANNPGVPIFGNHTTNHFNITDPYDAVRNVDVMKHAEKDYITPSLKGDGSASIESRNRLRENYRNVLFQYLDGIEVRWSDPNKPCLLSHISVEELNPLQYRQIVTNSYKPSPFNMFRMCISYPRRTREMSRNGIGTNFIENRAKIEFRIHRLTRMTLELYTETTYIDFNNIYQFLLPMFREIYYYTYMQKYVLNIGSKESPNFPMFISWGILRHARNFELIFDTINKFNDIDQDYTDTFNNRLCAEISKNKLNMACSNPSLDSILEKIRYLLELDCGGGRGGGGRGGVDANKRNDLYSMLKYFTTHDRTSLRSLIDRHYSAAQAAKRARKDAFDTAARIQATAAMFRATTASAARAAIAAMPSAAAAATTVTADDHFMVLIIDIHGFLSNPEFDIFTPIESKKYEFEELKKANKENINRAVYVAVEQADQNVLQWTSRKYRQDSTNPNLRIQIDVGSHASDVWYNILFQMTHAMLVLEKHKIYHRKMTMSNNVSIKELPGSNRNAFWKYTVIHKRNGEVSFYVPNKQYVVFITPSGKSHRYDEDSDGFELTNMPLGGYYNILLPTDPITEPNDVMCAKYYNLHNLVDLLTVSLNFVRDVDDPVTNALHYPPTEIREFMEKMIERINRHESDARLSASDIIHDVLIYFFGFYTTPYMGKTVDDLPKPDERLSITRLNPGTPILLNTHHTYKWCMFMRRTRPATLSMPANIEIIDYSNQYEPAVVRIDSSTTYIVPTPGYVKKPIKGVQIKESDEPTSTYTLRIE
jgi:hypothetical protein